MFEVRSHPTYHVDGKTLNLQSQSVPHPFQPLEYTNQHISFPSVLPIHLHAYLNLQKRSILRALRNPPLVPLGNFEDDEKPTNDIASQQLNDLISGTILRGEGNSCLLLGPRGSGKSRLVENCLSNLQDKPIILRLSGWAQLTDRVAMREIAGQLSQQTGTSFLSDADDDDPYNFEPEDEEEPNPFLDRAVDAIHTTSTASLPPSSHLPALISVIPTLSRPTVVILDAFDLFALHPRQSLLYCLLDTAQSCRAGSGAKGMAVIGLTSRVDTINVLEKRVKSRFSGRTMRTAAPRKMEQWVQTARAIMYSGLDNINHSKDDYTENSEISMEWKTLWSAGVERFLTDGTVLNVLNETFSVTRDVRMLSRILLPPVLHLSPDSPFLSISYLASAAVLQRSRLRFPLLHTLSYPSLCLLIASVHAESAGHPIMTFEMLHEYFRDQVRASTSAPVQVNGGSIGMVRCTREVLMSAFEELVDAKVLTCTSAPSPSIAKEFLKYRCVVERDEVKKAINRTGQINLKKWLNKAQ